MAVPTNALSKPESLKTGVPQSDYERLLLKDAKSRVEYKPFGGEHAITLSLQIIRDYIAVPYVQGDRVALPDDRQCMKFLMLCRSRALNPFEGDAFFIPFWDKQSNSPQWSLITAHNAFLKRAEIHPDYNGKRSGVLINPQRCKPCRGEGQVGGVICVSCGGKGYYDELEGDYVPEEIDGEEVKLRGGWCRVFLKEKANPEYQRLKLSTYEKGFGVWRNDPAGMICKCAEAAALRSAFPNVLGGMFLREEMQQNEPTGFASPDFKSLKSANPVGNGPKENQLFTPPPAEPLPERVPTAVPEQPSRTQELAPSDEQAEAAMGLAPSRTPTDGGGEKPKNVALLAIRNLCKMSAVPEGKLLEFLYDRGMQDGSISSLEELGMMGNGQDLLEKVNSEWQNIVTQLKAKK